MKSERLAWLMRKDAIEMVHASHASHVGSVLSVIDIIAVLYADILRVNPKEPNWEERDKIGRAHV